MPVVERDLSAFELPSSPPQADSEVTSFTLVSSSNAIFKGFTYSLSFPLANTYRVLLTGPDRPRPPHDNIILTSKALSFKLLTLDAKECTASFTFPSAGADTLDGATGKTREIHLDWSDSILLTVWEKDSSSNDRIRLIGDLPARSYALTEHGIIRHWWIERDNIHLGLGEKAGPIDLSGRSFQLHGTDAACYDTFESDPLYKHTPFLISTPRATEDGKPRNSTYAIYHPTNANAVWDLGRLHDDPWGYFKGYTQDWGGLEEYVMVGKGVKEVVRTFAELVGRPKLIGRDWLGYLGE